MNSKPSIRRQSSFAVFSSLVVLVIATDTLARVSSIGGTSTSSRTAVGTLPSQRATYYVSLIGSDSNDGLSRNTPWRTVQHAADLLNPGDTAIVTAGTYPERVTVRRSGASGRVITLTADSAATVTMQGFEITASYTQETGFDITNNNQIRQHGLGVYLVGSNNIISRNRIHDLCFAGIYVSGNGDPNSPGTANNLISYNTVTRAEMSGVTVEGQNNRIEYNDVSQTLQYPPNCPRNSGADADGFRFFGDGHIFKGNRITNIPIPGSQYNLNPHTDCFQTWSSATNMTFDRNWCQMPAPSVTPSSGGNEIGCIESVGGYVANLLFMNNVFINFGQGLVVHGHRSPLPGLQFLNNTVVNVAREGLILKNAPGAQISNNIFWNVGSGNDNYMSVDSESANFSAQTNDMYMSGGSNPGTYGSNAAHLTIDPQFVSASTLDFHLSPASPLINAGVSSPLVLHDHDGAARLQASGYHIGAF